VTLNPGTRLGSYEVNAPLGSGGMGDVYRAHDTRLDRDVAIKLLSSQLADDPGAIARFEREALSVAKLSHPNIVAIYEFGRAPLPGAAQDITYVATELVDGETLRSRLAHGPLQPRRAAVYAQQIARGIAAAHARGLVHRDLKPENVMITRDDQVKILDFGLAKPIPGVAAGTEQTRTVRVHTSAGTVLGTFGYMAPEQIRGLPVDHRADIFAFGALLYEMLSGDRAFKGETAADTMTAVLTKDPPDLDAAKLAISPALDRIVRRCLEKAPELRFQSGNDLAFALETLSNTTSSSARSVGAPVPAARRLRPAIAIPWIAAIAASAAAVWLASTRQADVRPWQHFTRITEAAGDETSPAISPDGTTVVYAKNLHGRWGIYAQRVGGHRATAIVEDPQRDVGSPAFSPDGASIAFHESDEDGGILIAGATGESVRRLTDIGFHPAWSPDGTQIAFTTEEISNPAARQGESLLYVVDVAGGAPKKIVDGDAAQPAWSPSGQRIVYWSNTGGQRDIYTVAASGGPRVPVVDDPPLDWCPVWSPDGRYIFFSSDRGGAMNLWRIAIDESSGRVSGQPEPVTAGVVASAALPSFSKDGSRLAFRSRVASVNPIAIPFDPSTKRAGVPVVLDSSNNARVPSAVSPDGKQVAYFSVGDQQEDLFLSAPDGSGMRRVTDDAWRDRGPMFTPDGAALVFYSNRDGHWAIWSIRTDGSNLRKIIGPAAGAAGDHGYVDSVLSPRGDRLAFFDIEHSPVEYVCTLSGGRAGPAEVLPNGTIDGKGFSALGWSRDGTRLIGQLTSPSGWPSGIGVYDFAARRLRKVSDDAAGAVAWLTDSRHAVYFRDPGSQLVVVDTDTGAQTLVDVHLPAPAISDVFAVSPDDRTIYYGAQRSESDIWIVERR
jgi:Tol biopolymer transport system component